jgi:hypothetical protein
MARGGFVPRWVTFVNPGVHADSRVTHWNRDRKRACAQREL